MNKCAKFNIGEIVIHTHQGYRAVIVDVDPLFQASGRFNPQAFKRSFSIEKLWYRLLVDNSSQVTYVNESLLARDEEQQLIDNPNLEDYLIQRHGRYHRNAKPN